MPTPDYDTTRSAPTDRYRRVAQVLPALRADATLRRSLRLFRLCWLPSLSSPVP